MANKVYEIYNGLPQYAKGVVVIGGMILGYIGVKAASDAIKRAKEAKKAKDRVKQFDLELGQTAKPSSYPDSQYDSWASAIVSAFSGCDYTSVGGSVPIVGYWFYWSDSGAALWNIIDQLKNDADFLKLNKFFGVRTISKSILCGGDYSGYDLTASVAAQLNQAERNGINSLLEKKGIKYRF